MYLLDTNVVSALRLPKQNRAVRQWADRHSLRDMFISTVTVTEITRGIELQRKKNPDYARELSNWLDEIILQFANRALAVDVPVARRFGVLSAALGNKEIDLAIAATALEHGLIVVTRNVQDFIRTGVEIYDPFAAKTHRPA
jgi:hypothetical protein